MLFSRVLGGVWDGDAIGLLVLEELVMECDVLLHIEEAVGVGIGLSEGIAETLGDLRLIQLIDLALAVLGGILFAQALLPADDVAGSDGGPLVDNILSCLNHFAIDFCSINLIREISCFYRSIKLHQSVHVVAASHNH